MGYGSLSGGGGMCTQPLHGAAAVLLEGLAASAPASASASAPAPGGGGGGGGGAGGGYGRAGDAATLIGS